MNGQRRRFKELILQNEANKSFVMNNNFRTLFSQHPPKAYAKGGATTGAAMLATAMLPQTWHRRSHAFQPSKTLSLERSKAPAAIRRGRQSSPGSQAKSAGCERKISSREDAISDANSRFWSYAFPQGIGAEKEKGRRVAAGNTELTSLCSSCRQVLPIFRGGDGCFTPPDAGL